MIWIDSSRVVYRGIVELHKVHRYEYKFNMDKNKLGLVECLDKDEVACCDEDVVARLDEGVLVCLYKSTKDFLCRFSPCTPLLIVSQGNLEW